MKNLLRYAAFLFFLMGSGVLSAQNGAYDLSFADGGKFMLDITNQGIDAANDMAEQTDHKLILAGYTTGPNGVDVLLIRLNEDGSLDSSFSTDGKAIFDVGIGGTDRLLGVALQADGKILGTGYVDRGSHLDLLLIRLNTDGTFDTSFGVGGIVKSDFSLGADEEGRDIAVMPDGRIVVAGYTEKNGQHDHLLARYLSDGSPDPSFSGNGFANFDPANGGEDELNAVALAPNGKIVAAGFSEWATNNHNMVTVQVDSTGSPDLSFSTDGFFNADIVIGADEIGYDIAVGSGGSVLIAGSTDDGGNVNATLMKLKSSGILDNTFGTTGMAYFDISLGNLDEFRGVALQADGKIIATGQINNGSSGYDFLVTKLNTDGTYYAAFGNGGHISVEASTGGGDYARSMCLMEDERILVGGYRGGRVAAVRLENEVGAVGRVDELGGAALEVWPQPCMDQLSLRIPVEFGNSIALEVLSLDGRVLLNRSIGMSASERETSLSLFQSQFKPGIYLLRLSGNGRSEVQKIMKY